MSVKLLLVFVEYNESNTLLLLQAIDRVDSQQGATFLLISQSIIRSSHQSNITIHRLKFAAVKFT